MNRERTTPSHPLAAIVFQALLLLTPRDFRYAYGRAMWRDLAENMSEEAHLHGAFAAYVLFAGACGDVVAGGLRERGAVFARDLRFALRSLRKTPLFTVVVVVTLALAIGTNAAVFSVSRAVVLAPLPYSEPDQLVAVFSFGARRNNAGVVSLPDAFDIRSQNHEFHDIAMFQGLSGTLTGVGAPRNLLGFETTWSTFAVLGVKPELGRFFDAADEAAGAGAPIVISDRLWHDKLGGRASVLGRAITIDAQTYRVIGVAPPGFTFPTPSDPWLPIEFDFWKVLRPDFNAYPRTNQSFNIIARLRPGASVESANADLTRIAAELEKRYPGTNLGRGFRAASFVDVFIGPIRPILVTTFAAVVAVLLIACANVANLLLSRGASRDRELAVRFAIGATRDRIVAQMLTETFLFAAVSGVLGIGLGALLVAGFVALHPTEIPRVGDIHIDAAVAAYTFGIVILCTLAGGIVPALTLSRPQLADALKVAGRGGDASRGARARDAFVVMEIAVSVALVITSGLVVRSFTTLAHTALGINVDGVHVFRATLIGPRYASDASIAAFYRDSVARVDAIPGVEQASWVAGTLPFLGHSSDGTVMQDVPQSVGGELEVSNSAIQPQFFRVMGILQIAGRAFTADDRLGTAPVAIVDRAFAQTYYRGHALGKWIQPGIGSGMTEPHRTIVGIVDNVRTSFMSDYAPTAYIPLAQVPQRSGVLVVRVHPGIALDPAISAAAVASDPLMAASEMPSLRDLADMQLARTRMSAAVLGSLAVVALFLAVAGIYAVVSFGVAQRTQEFGIRMALGSRGSAIVRDVVLRASRLAIVGIVAGIALAGFTTRLVQDQLFGVGPLDPATYAFVAVAVAAIALCAASIPAFRATRVDPVVALRYQ